MLTPIMKTLLVLLLCVAARSEAATVVRDFKMDELVKWTGGFVSAKHVENGVLSVETVKGNSMLISAVFNAFPATPSAN